jgi:hypothetical protein
MPYQVFKRTETRSTRDVLHLIEHQHETLANSHDLVRRFVDCVLDWPTPCTKASQRRIEMSSLSTVDGNPDVPPQNRRVVVAYI